MRTVIPLLNLIERGRGVCCVLIEEHSLDRFPVFQFEIGIWLF